MDLSQLTDLLGDIDPLEKKNENPIKFLCEVIEEKKCSKTNSESCALI